MSKCWSCGSNLAGGLQHSFTCPLCTMDNRIAMMESYAVQSLHETVRMREGLSAVASILEWGFEEIGWRLDQISGYLQSIDRTLVTPSQTQANEWRLMAEQLRRRGVLEQAEAFYLKSLETNPLCYRTYIGLGKTYIQMGERDKAKVYLQKSLPHAPRGNIDYQSYSYRLIGRLEFCEDNPAQAAKTLRVAIDLSPNYYLGYYDYAQYCAQIGDREQCLFSLRTAIMNEPLPLEVVERESNFQPVREEVDNLIETIKANDGLIISMKLKLIGDWAIEPWEKAEKDAKEAKQLTDHMLGRAVLKGERNEKVLRARLKRAKMDESVAGRFDQIFRKIFPEDYDKPVPMALTAEYYFDWWKRAFGWRPSLPHYNAQFLVGEIFANRYNSIVTDYSSAKELITHVERKLTRNDEVCSGLRHLLDSVSKNTEALKQDANLLGQYL